MQKFPKLTEYIDKLHNEVGVPSCGLIVYKNHEKIYEHFIGYEDSEKTKEANGETLYFMFSCTKPMTVTAGLMLWERGLLDIDAPVKKYLPEFKDVFLLKNGERVKPQNTMTVRHLFTMSAGLDYRLDTEPIREAIKSSNNTITTREMMKAIIASPLSFEPGEKFQYSLCHDVLACVIEAVSGKRFSDFMRENIFDPLGMKNTKFRISAEEKEARMANLYKWDEGVIRRFSKNNRYNFSQNYESGGAGLTSCASDYALFADAMACGGVGKNGYRLLKPETIEFMKRDALAEFLAHPETFSTGVGKGYTYGLGVRVLSDKTGGEKAPLGEFGWDGAAGSCFTADTENGIGMIYVQHMFMWPHAEGGDVHVKMRNIFYEEYEK
ncbi:MAG: beta-lactamase family protein [Clostridia bacterium]|nr:beta-lactamase family protein [Clostridia bacterium]